MERKHENTIKKTLLKSNIAKTKTSIYAIVLMTLIIFASAMYAQPVRGKTQQLNAFIIARPNPIGVGQTALISWYLTTPPPGSVFGGTVNVYKNVTLTVTTPDGVTKNMGPYSSGPIGDFYTNYTPDKVGTYYFQMNYPGQTLGGIDFLPVVSSKLALTVQQDPIPEWPAAPLPTDYWQRPINTLNREWSSISGNWLGGGFPDNNWNQYTTAPESAHIVWTKERLIGGIIGGEFGSDSYYSGMANRENPIQPPIVINGKLYYNTATYPKYGFYCVDLRTGRQLWYSNDSRLLTMGQTYDFPGSDARGGLPFLWSNIGKSTWSLFDANTGNWICDLTNASSGSMQIGPNGELLYYVLNGNNNWLAMWNSSRVQGIFPGGTAYTPSVGATLNWNTGIQWNKTLDDVPGVQSINTVSDDVISARATFTQDDATVIAEDMAYSTLDGTRLWGPVNRTAVATLNNGAVGDGVMTAYVKETMTWYGYSTHSGQLVWTTTLPGNPFDLEVGQSIAAYGNLYFNTYGGYLYCINLNSGKLLWTFYTGSAGFEAAFGGGWPFSCRMLAADGKIYITNGASVVVQPQIRGQRDFCLNASTGDTIWAIKGEFFGRNMGAIADGYMVSYNIEDAKMYCFGKGQTATTVSTAIGMNSRVLIQGTISDQSPGDTCLGIPAAGTPAISDESMSTWMEYLYMQQPKPTNATGVPVSIDAIDPNGNSVHIGDTQSTSSGQYALAVDPSKFSAGDGMYTIIATFAGTNAYYQSSAETSMYFNLPAATAAPPTATPISVADMYFVPTIVATLVLLIIIIVALAFLMLRKRA